MKRLTAALMATAAGLGVPTVAQADPPAPQTCFTYSAEQWLQLEYTATAVDCVSEHNGEVLGLVTSPPEFEVAGYGAPALRAWAFQACQTVGMDYVWRTGTPRYPKASIVLPRTARLNVQIPTGEQWAQGQRWVACLGQSRNVRLTAAESRVGSVRALGVRPFVCYTPRGWKGTSCSKPDAVKLTHQVWLASSYDAEYPGSDKLLTKAQRSCERLRRKGDTLRTWFIPGLKAWERGNRYGFCEFVK